MTKRKQSRKGSHEDPKKSELNVDDLLTKLLSVKWPMAPDPVEKEES